MTKPGIGDYLNVMRKQGEQAATNNPGNPEQYQLRQDLIEYYRENKQKALEVIKNGQVGLQSQQHSIHYNCAKIAIEGYPDRKSTRLNSSH